MVRALQKQWLGVDIAWHVRGMGDGTVWAVLEAFALAWRGRLLCCLAGIRVTRCGLACRQAFASLGAGIACGIRARLVGGACVVAWQFRLLRGGVA